MGRNPSGCTQAVPDVLWSPDVRWLLRDRISGVGRMSSGLSGFGCPVAFGLLVIYAVLVLNRWHWISGEDRMSGRWGTA